MTERWRLYAVMGSLMVFLLTSTVRLVDLQILEHGQWRDRAEQIQVRQVTQTQRRGSIIGRHGRRLAFDVRATSVALDNYRMTKPELLTDLIVDHLDLSEQEAEDRIYRPSYFTWIARKVDPATAEALKADAEAKGVKGLIFKPEWERAYPQGSLASNVIGFAGIDNEGLEGLEQAYNDHLSGQREQRSVVRGADGTVLEEHIIQSGRAGDNLELTLDARIQAIAESEIQAGVAEHRANGGFAVVADPQTGELLAIAQDKTYDLNEFRHSSPEQRANLAAVQPFEPGSTFKPFAMLAALQTGSVRPGDTINGDGPVTIAGHRINNAEHRSLREDLASEVLEMSVNTGIVRIAQDLGQERLHRFLSRMRFGEETSLALPGEAAGTLRPLEDWSELSIGTMPIGQGISVTGLQLTRAYSAIANGGRLTSLQLVRNASSVGSSDANGASERIADRTHVAQLASMMEQVVHGDRGTGVYAQVNGFRVAGKSGTGQKAIPGRGYVEGRYTSLFGGFFPADDPRYLILVVLDDVQAEQYYGGLTAAPIFKEIASGIIDDRHPEPNGSALEN